jgi:transglutaminase-like putative cysteine protease
VSVLGFRERALAEAARYGPDPWVFVRELLQNARDAGARSVVLEAGSAGGRDRVLCRDDGCGMSFEHARRFLFALYASSKGGPRDAGRFGVGFWSVLRFEPERIVVRSWTRRGAAWEVALDGALQRPERRPAPSRRGSGTEVELERAARGEAPAARVLEAARDAGRFLLRRDAPRPLRVRVNGAVVEAPFDLPPPRSAFRRGRERGVVALGREARCELFVKGLKVRETGCLEELLAPESAEGPAALAPGAGLAPQALLDGERLEVLLARGDARSSRALARLVANARRELGRLVKAQIAALRPVPRWRRAAPWLAGVLAVAAAGGLWLGPFAQRSLPPPAAAAALVPSPVAPAPGMPRPYRDLGWLYRGPLEDGLGGAARLALRYSPPERSLLLAAAVVEPGDGAESAPAVGPYVAPPRSSGSVEIELVVEDAPGWVRLPVPTGHRIDPATLRVEGRGAALAASRNEEPLIEWPGGVGRLVSYRAAPALGAWRDPAPVALPASYAPWVESVGGRAFEERVVLLAARVAEAIRYTTSTDAALRMRARRAEGEGFAAAAVAVGAGDCDVQNGVLALLLRAAGVPARLVVGPVGRGGAALPGLHAWVEYANDGRWVAADASAAGSTLLPAAAGEPSVAGAPPLVAAPPVAANAEAPGIPRRVPERRIAILLGAALAAVGLVALGRRTRRELALDPAADLAALVTGALRRPEAFAAAPAVFRTPLLPTLAGGRVSVVSAWDAAVAGRLFASGAESPLARRAARAGACVLATRSPEAHAAADALGASDLDAWDALLTRSAATPLLREVMAALAPRDAVLVVGGGEGASIVLDLGVPGALPGRASRAILLGKADAAWRASEERFGAAPADAVFRLAAHVTERLGLSADRRARRLAPLAAGALLEADR